MRLTLRTLLAYMDEILEPGDHEELTKKIESSEFANDLILRTKDTMRRLRLSAPQLVGSGIGLDPNTVAEYLDNVLPPDSVADLERICLESDVHLAEVASCHHVLTMVLGEPAEVDPAWRERMYSIPSEARERKQVRVEPAHSSLGAARAVGEVAPVPPKFAPATFAGPARSAKPREVPDYLRASVWNQYRVLLVALAAVLVLGLTVLLTSGLKGWRGKPSPDGANETIASTAGQQGASAQGNSLESNGVPFNGDRSTTPMSSNTGKAQAVDATTESHYAVPDNATPAKSGSPPPLLIPNQSGPTAASSPANATTEIDAGPAAAPAPAASSPISQESAGGAAPSATIATPAPQEVAPGSLPSGAETRLASNTPPIPVASSNAAPSGTRSGPSPAEAAPVVGQTMRELGSYLDGKEILLRRDTQSGTWMRLLPRSSIHATDRLVSLPAFHPRITLSSGIQLKLSGGTEVSLNSSGPVAGDGAASKGAIPAVEVVYGRAVFVNTANVENPLEISVGGTTATVHLAQNATLAVEALRSYVPGRDPRQSPAPVRAHLYAPDGNVVWNDAAGEQTIHAPSQWEIVDGAVSAAVAAPSLPEWIDGEPAEQRTEQLYGAPVVEQSIDAKRPVETQLLELFQTSHKREVKSLVARSSVYVGLFVPFVEALRDTDQRATWKTQIETLRSAMALGPDAANKIWETLKEQRGEPVAHDLYEMLCGYSTDQIGRTPEQIASGAIPKLIDWLEKDDLDYRVLAVQDLGEITGKHLMPHPEASPTERAKGVRIWRERLKAGEVGPGAAQ